ncbi:MAG: hypothetical protein Q8O88_00730 [bacterium]|nr:hypothetical protein [bacterium]
MSKNEVTPKQSELARNKHIQSQMKTLGFVLIDYSYLGNGLEAFHFVDNDGVIWAMRTSPIDDDQIYLQIQEHFNGCFDENGKPIEYEFK